MTNVTSTRGVVISLYTRKVTYYILTLKFKKARIGNEVSTFFQSHV
jgi:hypothetical protein